MKKFIFGSAIALLLITHTYAQDYTQTIKGRLVDQQSKSPIIGATIVVKDSDPLLGNTTDVDGYFRIPKVPIGRQTLIFSSIGYESKTIPNITVTSGKEVVLEIDLIESLIQMDEIVIVADKQEKGQPQNEMATVSAISLSVEETSRTPATFGDPARAALSQPGVTTGGDDLLNEIVIRGNSPKGILWRLEGVEIPNPNHFASVGSSAGGISMLSSSVLSNSDFFTAAFPAQYGNATSGIFDLRMRNGNFDKREHSFDVGLLGIQASSEGPFSKSSNASYLINYRYSTLGLLSAVGLDILGDQEAVVFQDLSLKVNIPTEKLGKFSIWALGGDNTYTFKPNPDYGEKFYDDDKQKMGAMGLTHVAYLNKDTYVESVASLTASSYKYRFDSLRIRVFEKENIDENTLRLSSFINHKFNARNTLRVGGIVSRMNFDLYDEFWVRQQAKYIVDLNQKGSTYFLQGFAQWQHRINEDITINAGFHTSHFVLNNDTYIEPRAGFRWKTSSKGTVTGGVGLHSRMETLSLYMSQDSLGIKPNKNLGFTKAAHSVLGYEYAIRPDIRFKAEVYYQFLYNVPVWPSDTVSNPELRSFSVINSFDGYTSVPLANKGEGENYGLELTLEKFFTKDYFFMINGSIYESKYSGIDGVEHSTLFNGNYIFNVLGGKEFAIGSSGRNTLNINGRFILAGGKREAPILLTESRDLSDEHGFNYTARDYTRNYAEKLPAYMRVDFGISYKRNRPSSSSVVSINVQNVTARENAYGRYYYRESDEVVTESQLGFFPNLSYRIEF